MAGTEGPGTLLVRLYKEGPAKLIGKENMFFYFRDHFTVKIKTILLHNGPFHFLSIETGACILNFSS